MAHIIFICTANICRSPVAEELLRDRLRKIGLEDWTVSSAGTWAQIKRGAAQNSVRVMEGYGLDLSNHVSEMVDLPHLEQADLALCMEVGHAEALRVEFPQQAHKVFLLSEMVGQHYSVADPYGGPLSAYQQMVSEVADLIDRGLSQIVSLAKANASAS